MTYVGLRLDPGGETNAGVRYWDHDWCEGSSRWVLGFDYKDITTEVESIIRFVKSLNWVNEECCRDPSSRLGHSRCKLSTRLPPCLSSSLNGF